MSTRPVTGQGGLDLGEGRWLAFWGTWTKEDLLMRAWLETPEREGARIIVSNQHGQILMMLRGLDAATNPGKWTAPGGQLHPREEPDAAARRVLAAETGLRRRPETLAPLGLLSFTALHDGAWVLHHLFTTQVTAIEERRLMSRLGGGQAPRFFDWPELRGLDISPSARSALAIAWRAVPTPSRPPGTDSGMDPGTDSGTDPGVS